MKTSNVLLLLALPLSMAATCTLSTMRDSRSVRPVAEPMLDPSRPFDRAQSAALFVGVREFADPTLPLVRYAVDDAVDLAHAFVFDNRIGLVDAEAVVLALAGTPQKEESRQRLQELRDAGATIVSATADDIRQHFQSRLEAVGRDGLLIVSFATHGFLDQSRHSILGSASLMEPDTAIDSATLIDLAATARSQRSLFLIDACRERLPEGARGGGVREVTTAPLLNRRGAANGQVILWAAAAGQYAYDDDRLKNGVFTKYILEGLRGEAGISNGAITAETLARYVNKQVQKWLRSHDKPNRRSGIQSTMDGGAKNMPLAFRAARCRETTGPGAWYASMAGDKRIADLDLNCFNEVVVRVQDALVIYDANGAEWHRFQVSNLLDFAVGDLHRKKAQQIVALAAGDGNVSTLSIFQSDGTRRSHTFAGSFQHVTIDRPTTRHAPRIILSGTDGVCVIRPRRMELAWCESLAINAPLTIADHDRDGRREIALSLASRVVHLDIENGKRLPVP